jgi:ornithine cyclodeaminase/alanine dehydrogenase-like protein (mu-crystallin family)
MNRSTLYLNRDAVEAVNLPMRRIIEVVEAALIEKAHGRVQMPPKTWLAPDPSRWFGAMSSLVPSMGYAALKWQSGSTGNVARGLPYLTGMLLLNKLDDGVVAAVMDSTWITQQRTAAASAIAVTHLARKNATSYAMLGCGVQARSHFEAFRQVLPALEEVVAFDTNAHAANAFAREVGEAGVRTRVAASARAAIDASDIVVTGGPIAPDASRAIDASWLHRGMTAITIDYDCYFKAAAFEAADKLFTDDFGQIEHIKEHGYFVDCPRPHAELASVVAGLCPGRESEDETIVCINMGIAVEDVATAREIYEIARSRKIGTELAL